MIQLMTYLTTFLIIILAELGDKTQVATLIYSSNYPHKRWQVFLAAALALITCVLLEVTVGLMITKIVSPNLINKITGVIFIIIGIISFRSFLKDLKRQERPIKRATTIEIEQEN